jgi:hypothetical protein
VQKKGGRSGVQAKYMEDNSEVGLEGVSGLFGDY